VLSTLTEGHEKQQQKARWFGFKRHWIRVVMKGGNARRCEEGEGNWCRKIVILQSGQHVCSAFPSFKMVDSWLVTLHRMCGFICR